MKLLSFGEGDSPQKLKMAIVFVKGTRTTQYYHNGHGSNSLSLLKVPMLKEKSIAQETKKTDKIFKCVLFGEIR